MDWITRFLNTALIGPMALFERRLPFLPYEYIDQLQRYRLHSIIKHAYKTVPFYRLAMNERGLRPEDFKTIKDIAKLPLIDGEIVNKNQEAFCSSAYQEGAYQIYSTSGSQLRVRRKVYWDNRSVLLRLPRDERERIVMNRLLEGDTQKRQLLILSKESQGILIRAFCEERTLISGVSAPRIFLSPELPYERAVECINQLEPDVIYSYGSYADHFFRFLIDRNIPIKAPRVWKYGSDMLSLEIREMIESRFGSKVFSAYGAVEAGIIGFQCELLGGYHLNVDLCPIRIVDKDGLDVEPEQSGEVVISNLHNRAMVLLNYRLGDIAALSGKKCMCGRSLPLMDRLEGRNVGEIELSDGRQISVLVLRSFCIQELRTMRQAQLVQLSPRSFCWRFVPFSGVDQQVIRQRILDKMNEYFGSELQVEVEFVEHIPNTPQGKFNAFIPYREKVGGGDS